MAHKFWVWFSENLPIFDLLSHGILIPSAYLSYSPVLFAVLDFLKPGFPFAGSQNSALPPRAAW